MSPPAMHTIGIIAAQFPTLLCQNSIASWTRVISTGTVFLIFRHLGVERNPSGLVIRLNSCLSRRLDFVLRSRLYCRGFIDLWFSLNSTSLIFFGVSRSEEHTSELQSLRHLVCRL